jgi:hypothetical protein
MYFDLEDEKEEIGFLISKMLTEGCWTRDEIIWNLSKERDQLDDVGFNELINVHIRRKLEDEHQYPETTDCDKFYRAFTMLSEVSALALHCPGSTFTSSYYAAGQEWLRLGGAASGLKGTIFYDPQCVEGALDTFQLPIYFRAFPTEGSDPYAATKQSHVEFGTIVLLVMTKAGLNVEWDTPDSFGMNVMVNWQKRFDAVAFEVKSEPGMV